MKLTALLLTIACLNLKASGYSQTITFSGKDVPLKVVLTQIEQQTGLSFFFNYQLIKDAKPITLEVRNASLQDVLNKILRDDQGLDYYQSGKTIFIIQKKLPVTGATTPPGPLPADRQINVKGRVTNIQGEALPGASVSVRNGGKQTLTNEKGNFELKAVQANAMLEVSYIGYERKQINIDGQETISVQLTVAEKLLDQAQVIPYGTTSQRESIGNITTVKADEIARQPVGNALLTLEGKVPGLFITQTNGQPGSGVTVRIQGINSIGNGNDPLYVIDGVPYASQMLPTTTGGTNNILGGSGASAGAPGGSGNPLNYINPSDIESIDVLKDADATAIYGSRAANGAILITTKRGKAGDSRFDLSAQEGFGQVAKKLKLMNTTQYLQMRHEAIRNEHLNTSATDYDINGTWDTTRYTDWQKVFLGGTSQYTNVNGSVSGGNANTKYLLGSTYHKEGTVYPSSFYDQKVSLHLSMNSASIDNRFKMQLIGNYMADNNYLPYNDFSALALSTAPDAPKLFNSDGTLNWMPTASGTSTWTNPLAYTYNKYQNKTNNLIGNAVLGYLVLPGLDFRVNLGYNRLETNEFEGFSLLAARPESRPGTTRTAYYTNSIITTWVVEPQATYQHVIGNGKLDVVVGATIQQNNSNGQNLLGVGYNSDAVLQDIHSAATVSVNSSVASIYKYNATFSRINYSWREKYILEISGRRDGSSRFGAQNQFHDFGSVGAGWIFSEEDFIKNFLPAISFGKLKASYGTTGNDQIGDYKFLSLYAASTTTVPYQNIPGLTPTGLPNPYLQWELTKKWQAGLDLGFANDRLLLTAVYQLNRSSNELLAYQLPIFTGFGQYAENFPATIQNTSWEFTLHSINIKHKNLTWSTSLNLTVPRNKLVSFPNLSTSTYASTLVIGDPVNIIKAYHSLGVNPLTGAYQFASNGKPVATPNLATDRTSIITPGARWYGGIQNTIGIKGFRIDFTVMVVKQIGPRVNYFFNAGSSYPPGFAFGNQTLSVLSRWKQSGDLTAIQRFSSNYTLLSALSNETKSDAYYGDASYVRLKNLSLSYQMPEKWARKAGIKEMRLYALGQNLLTWTHFAGLDPETLAATLPPLRVISFGLQLSL